MDEELILQQEEKRLDEDVERAVLDALSEAVDPDSYNDLYTKHRWSARYIAEIEGYLNSSSGIEYLLRDDYFLGFGNKIYPSVLDDILELYEERKTKQINIVGFVEGIGAGKSEKASAILWLNWLELCCKGGGIVTPQEHYNLTKGSVIGFAILSKNEKLAKKVSFTKVWKRFNTPFNRDFFPPSVKFKNEISIDRNKTLLFPGTGSAMSALGYDLFGGWIDEANFLEVVEDSKKASITSRYDAAEEMANNIKNRMVSRFLFDGHLPGMLILTSSPRHPNDYLERKIRENELLGDRSMIFTRRRAMWVAKGEKAYPPKKGYFYIDVEKQEIVEVGRAEKLLELKHFMDRMKCKVYDIKMKYLVDAIPAILKVPNDLKSEFEDNRENFIRNIGCVPLEAMRPFFKRKHMLERVIDYSRKNPLQEIEPYNFEDWYKCVNPEAYRYIHMDLAFNKDTLGIACVHCSGFKERLDFIDNEVVNIMQPLIHVDFLGRIKAPPNEEIILEEAISVIFKFRRITGSHIRLATFDKFQSKHFTQSLRRQGILSTELSVDRTATRVIIDYTQKDGYRRESTNGNTVAAMEALKKVIYQERISILNHPHYLIEARGAEYDEIKVKVDHSPMTTIDMLQALAACVYNLENNTKFVDREKIDKELEAAKDSYRSQISDSYNRHLRLEQGNKELSAGDSYYKDIKRTNYGIDG